MTIGARWLGLMPLLLVRCDCSTYGLGAGAAGASTSGGVGTASTDAGDQGSTDPAPATDASDPTTVSTTSDATQGEDSCEGSPTCPRWARALLDVEGAHSAEAHVGVDAAGNVVVAGSFAGTVDFGGTVVTSESELDIFVASYSPAGELTWLRVFATADVSGYTYNNDVAVSQDGRIYIVGTTNHDIDLGDGLRSVAMAGSDDIFVAKYTQGGVPVWSQVLGQTGQEGGLHVALDSQENVVVAGYFRDGALDLGGGTMTSLGEYDAFVLKVDAAGSHLWSEAFGGADTDMIRNMMVDHDDAVVVLGDFTGTLESDGEVVLKNNGWNDPFVLKLDAAGAVVWSEVLVSGANTGYVTGLAAGPHGSILLAGWFEQSLEIGGSPVATDDASPFLSKLDSDGAHVWSRVFPVLEGGAVDLTTVGLGVAASGEIWLAATVAPPIDMLGGLLEPRGGQDVVLATYDVNGEHRWSGRFGDWSEQRVGEVGVDGAGDVIVTGTFLGALEFVEGDELRGQGASRDIFVAKLGDCPACE